ncbi:hypothetical protein SAMD00019534_104310, partial [Acytostelium subglobosum LB1]|uniref:hypothetical protein n=1 Tax=Acytostelium subglobosum LB1 TaxID=1410327 RepID=UPI0006451059
PRLLHLKLDEQFNHSIHKGDLPDCLVSLELGHMFSNTITPGALPLSLKHLTYRGGQTQHIVPGLFPPSLIMLTMSTFNFVLAPNTLPLTLRLLNLGQSYNLPIDIGVLPDGLTSLSLGNQFDQLIEPGALPNSITSLRFGNNFSHMIQPEALPNSLIYLTLGERNTHQLNTGVPQSLTSLTLYGQQGMPLSQTLPPTIRHLVTFNSPWQPRLYTNMLESLEVNSEYGWSIKPATVPFSLTSLKLGCGFTDFTDGALPPSLETLVLGNDYDRPIGNGLLPDSIKHLKMGNNFNQLIETLPPALVTLEFGECYNIPIINDHWIPTTLQSLTFGLQFDQPLTAGLLPESLTHLRLGLCFKYTSMDLPQSLTSLSLSITNRKKLATAANGYLVFRSMLQLREIPSLPHHVKTLTIYYDGINLNQLRIECIKLARGDNNQSLENIIMNVVDDEGTNRSQGPGLDQTLVTTHQCIVRRLNKDHALCILNRDTHLQLNHTLPSYIYFLDLNQTITHGTKQRSIKPTRQAMAHSSSTKKGCII